jgi:transaldolase
MSLYLDSANIKEATTAVKTGWIKGITTNPAILSRSGFSPEETLIKLAVFEVSEIFYQVRSADLPTMMEEMKRAESILGEKLVVKIPPTHKGFQFASKISSNHKTCLTAIFSPAQALAARETGADYIAVYVNRATRLTGDGIKLTMSIADVLDGSGTEIIAASLKSQEEVIAAFNAGAQHLTLPFDVLSSLIENPHSQQAVEQFDQFQAHLLSKDG